MGRKRRRVRSRARSLGDNGYGASLLSEKVFGLRADGFGLGVLRALGIEFEIGVQVRQDGEQIALAKMDLGEKQIGGGQIGVGKNSLAGGSFGVGQAVGAEQQPCENEVASGVGGILIEAGTDGFLGFGELLLKAEDHAQAEQRRRIAALT